MIPRNWFVFGLAFMAACSLESTVDPPEQFQWTGSLVAEPGWELEGDAGFIWTEGRGRFLVGIAVTDDEAFALRPWHVHRGSCDDRGAIVGDSGEYPLLVMDGGGAAEIEAVIDDSLSPSRDYYVDVHLSDQELSTIIACGATLLVEEITP